MDGLFPDGWQVTALWPAPVNDDACFAAAGFHEMQSDCEDFMERYWDNQADLLHSLIVRFLTDIGEPALQSVPLLSNQPWFHFWQKPIWLPLSEQLEQPMLNDSLPDCDLRFGSLVGVRSGNGHRLYWLGFAPQSLVQLANLLEQLGARWNIRNIALDWHKLGARHVEVAV
jgi:hypothetical protein